VAQELPDLGGAHIARMPLAAPEDELPDPVHVRLFRARGEVPEPADLPALVEKPELGIGNQVLPGRTG
jgi:hypothetical protein